MKFHYTTAAFACTQCSYSALSHAPALAGFYLAVSFLAAVPLGFILLRAPWSLPWYSLFGVLAGELLTLFAIGFLIGPFLGVGVPSFCPRCGASVTLRGRYFSDSPRPRLADIIVLAFFAAANVSTIIYVWPSRFFQ